VRGCVVKVSGVWVRGNYSEYGWVECAHEGQADPVQVWLQQFQSDFEHWGVPADALIATSVYCADPARSCVPGLQIWHALPAATPPEAAGAWAQRNGFTEAQAAMIGECVWVQDGVATLADLHEMDVDTLTCMHQNDMQLPAGEEARFRSLLAVDATGVAEFNAAWDREHKDEDEDEEDAGGQAGFGFGGAVVGVRGGFGGLAWSIQPPPQQQQRHQSAAAGVSENEQEATKADGTRACRVHRSDPTMAERVRARCGMWCQRVQRSDRTTQMKTVD
jgi:hypothetical protein